MSSDPTCQSLLSLLLLPLSCAPLLTRAGCSRSSHSRLRPLSSSRAPAAMELALPPAANLSSARGRRGRSRAPESRGGGGSSRGRNPCALTRHPPSRRSLSPAACPPSRPRADLGRPAQIPTVLAWPVGGGGGRQRSAAAAAGRHGAGPVGQRLECTLARHPGRPAQPARPAVHHQSRQRQYPDAGSFARLGAACRVQRRRLGALHL